MFAPLIPFMYVDIVVDNILKGLDAQVNVLFINIIDLLVSISFIFFFVPAFGIKGFIASIFASEILNFGLSLKKVVGFGEKLVIFLIKIVSFFIGTVSFLQKRLFLLAKGPFLFAKRNGPNTKKL